MGTTTIKAPINHHQLTERLVTCYSTSQDDGSDVVEVTCQRMTDAELEAALKGLRYDPEAPEPNLDPGEVAAAEAQTAALLERTSAEERVEHARAVLAQAESDAAHIDREVAGVAGVIDERVETLRECETAYEAASDALLKLKQAAKDGRPVGERSVVEAEKAEELAKRRVRAGAQDVHYSIVDAQLARDAAAKWKATDLDGARERLAEAEAALKALD